MAAVLPDLSVTITQRRWACVIDPTLALSAYGLTLVKRLRWVMSVWVVRELWNILDNTHYYLREPAALLTKHDRHRDDTPECEALVAALRGWEQLRIESDPTALGICWIGDTPNESLLPEEQDPAILWRFERLSFALDRRGNCMGSLESAFRDTLALAVAEGQALVLTHLPLKQSVDAPPAICEALNLWSIPCRIVPAQTEMLRLERETFERLLVQAGVADLCFAGWRPSIMHIVAPGAAALYPPRADIFGFTDENGSNLLLPTLHDEHDPWQGSQAFWYPLDGVLA